MDSDSATIFQLLAPTIFVVGAIYVLGPILPIERRWGRILAIAAVWLIGQCNVFLRNREQLANPPVSLVLDEAAIDDLAGRITGWALSGLSHSG